MMKKILIKRLRKKIFSILMVLSLFNLSLSMNVMVCQAVTPVPQNSGQLGKAEQQQESKGTGKTLTDNVSSYITDMESGKVSSQMGKFASGNTSAVGIAGQIYVIVRTLVLILILIFSIIALMKVAAEGGKGRGDGKKLLTRSMISILAIASVASFIGACWSIGSSLWK